MSAFLPLQDPDHPSREVLLRSARNIYQYNYTYVLPLAILARVPFKDEFSVGWLMHMAERVAVMFANRAELEIHGEIPRSFGPSGGRIAESTATRSAAATSSRSGAAREAASARTSPSC